MTAPAVQVRATKDDIFIKCGGRQMQFSKVAFTNAFQNIDITEPPPAVVVKDANEDIHVSFEISKYIFEDKKSDKVLTLSKSLFEIVRKRVLEKPEDVFDLSFGGGGRCCAR